MANFALDVTRLAFSALQAVSADLAGRAAFQLFCRTPSPIPKGAKAKMAHAAGAARLAGAEHFTLKLAGGRGAHAYRLNGGARGKRKRYLVTHGWGSSAAYMAELVSMLAASGAEVVALDFPGHGRSGGRFLHMGLAVETIAAAEARFGAFDAAIGHSFGGAALMVSAAGLLPGVAPLAGERLALIGAPSEMGWLFTDFGGMIGLRPAAQAAAGMRFTVSPDGDWRISTPGRRPARSAGRCSSSMPRMTRRCRRSMPGAMARPERASGFTGRTASVTGASSAPRRFLRRSRRFSMAIGTWVMRRTKASKKMQRSFRFLSFRQGARHCSVRPDIKPRRDAS